MTDRAGRVFIAYERSSDRVAKRLHQSLTTEGFTPWLDTKDLKHTDGWPIMVDRALREADRMVVLLTNASTRSREVFQEWFYFYSIGKPIHLVKLEECEPHFHLLPLMWRNWSRDIDRCWPDYIRDLVSDLRKPFHWPDSTLDTPVVASEFAPRRTVSEACDALERAIRRPEQLVTLSDEQLREIGSTPPTDLRTYRLARFARWCAPRYQLDRRFVRLTLMLDEGADVVDRWVPSPSRMRMDDLAELIDTKDSFVCVLLGSPGAGKTTLLRRLEMDTARRGIVDPEYRVIPFCVSLAEYGMSAEPGEVESPLQWLSRRWSARLAGLGTFKEQLDNGNILLLLDGLNEMAHTDARDLNRRLDGWRAFLYSHICDIPGNRAIVACRTLDYSGVLSSKDVGIPHIRLEPMSPGQVLEYIGIEAPTSVQMVRATLAQNPSAWSFMRNPYMLRLVTGLIRAEGAVPLGRADIFAGFVRDLLRREIHPENRSLSHVGLLTDRERRRLRDDTFACDPYWLPDRGELVPALSRLAYGMQMAKVGEEKGNVAVDYDNALGLIGLSTPQSEAVLKAGCDIGVLDESEGAVRFFHHLLQEFFAARLFATQPHTGLLTVPIAVAEVDSPLEAVVAALAPGDPLPPLRTTGWEESAIMAAAMAVDPDRFVRSVLTENLIVAARCVAAPDVRVSASLRAEIANRVLRAISITTDIRARISLGRVLGHLDDPRYRSVSSGPQPALMPEFVRIPAGRYPIGRDHTQYHIERPAHEVRIAEFEIARLPVTNREFAAFIDSGGYTDDRWWPTASARRWRDNEGVLDIVRREWLAKRAAIRTRPQLPVELLRDGRATLQQAVSMVKLVAMSDAEVTAALEQLHGSGRHEQPAFWGDSRFNWPSAPVVGVSVYEAEAYCQWLSAVTGQPIRMVTEYEWEAAGGGFRGNVFPGGTQRAG